MHEDRQVLDTLPALLRRRYEADYEVVAAPSATERWRWLERARDDGQPVPVVLCGQEWTSRAPSAATPV